MLWCSIVCDLCLFGIFICQSIDRFKIVRQLGEGGFAFVYLVKEVINESSDGGISKKFKNSTHLSGIFYKDP